MGIYDRGDDRHRVNDMPDSASSRWKKFLETNGFFNSRTLKAAGASDLNWVNTQIADPPKKTQHNKILEGRAAGPRGIGPQYEKLQPLRPGQVVDMIRIFRPGQLGLKANWHGDRKVTKI